MAKYRTKYGFALDVIMTLVLCALSYYWGSIRGENRGYVMAKASITEIILENVPKTACASLQAPADIKIISMSRIVSNG